jgi:hypothetical protein
MHMSNIMMYVYSISSSSSIYGGICSTAWGRSSYGADVLLAVVVVVMMMLVDEHFNT